MGSVDDTDLVYLAERLDAEGTGDLAGYAESLPSTLGGRPEAALALARLYLRLHTHLRHRPLPQWRTADLPPPVQIAWLRAEIAVRAETVRDEPAGELLYQAVRGLRATDPADAATLAHELADRPDPVLRREGLRLTREAVRAGLLAPDRARALVVRVAGAAAQAPGPGTAAIADLAVAALRELAEPWAALDPLPPEHLHRFLDGDQAVTVPAVADAVIEAAARHGQGDVLLDVVADDERPPALRRRALELLGDLAHREDVGAIAGIAAEDPLLLAGPAVRCLRGLHRRGHFPAAADVPAIVGLALADHTVPADELGTILFTCRHETFGELTAADTGDPTWPRRLELLVALAAQGITDVPVGAHITGLLDAAPDPSPFLRAIRALRHEAAEETVIAVLPRSAPAALDALEAVGGSRTVAALREGLGLDESDGTVVPCLRPVRHRALELLWHLTEDVEQRRSLLDRLDPRDLPRRIAADLGGPDERELALLRAGLDPDEPAESLCRLARNGSAGTVPAIADLLLRVVSGLAASWAPGHEVLPGAVSEPVVPEEVVSAISGLGGRLHERTRIRPRCLLDAAGAREAGDALVAGIALDLLDRPELTPPEQMILLGLLLRVSCDGIRARVHPLLRHRDRHVRKHVIALLARDGDGADAQALSASLVPLTSAPDAQTVRQALLALGHAHAHWAAAAIAACLDHPNMNVKKTAAAALIRAGAPVAVPRLLFWLGTHDNPGLRDTLVEASRAILGDAFAATVVSAADHADDRTRTLLLSALDGSLPARAIGALADQGSPAGRTLLSLVAAGRLALVSGTAAELAERMAAHDMTPPVVPAGTTGTTGDDAAALAARGWITEIARRLVDRYEEERGDRADGELLGRLRPMLARWLELSREGPERRVRVLRFVLRLCPAPWTDAELETFGRWVQVLVGGLPGAGDEDRDRLLALLVETVPRLSAAAALDVAEQIRGLPRGAAGSRSALLLLRRCGAVLTRDDLDRALTAARTGPDPWPAVGEVLREAFGTVARGEERPAERPVARRWREALEGALRTPGGLRRLRDADLPGGDADRPGGDDEHPVDSRERLAALIDVYRTAAPDAGDVLVDWMIELQPIGVPTWTIAEDAGRPVPPARAPYRGDLDQPRSAAQRERLLAMLDDPLQSRRNATAQALADWPEPQIRLAVLRAFLHGRVELTVNADLARTLAVMSGDELRAITGDDAAAVREQIVREQIVRLVPHLDPPELERLVPLLVRWWESGVLGTDATTLAALRRAAPDVMAEVVSARLEAGEWRPLDLIVQVPLLRTPALTAVQKRLRDEGRDDLAEKIVLVDGPLRAPGAVQEDSATLSALRIRVPEAAAREPRRPTREELVELARTGGAEQIRRALSLLAERHEDAGADRDPEFEELLAESIGHRSGRVRLHAHRISRRVLTRPDYLGQTTSLLADPQPDIVRSAIRTVCHAGWQPAIPALIGLLAHPHPTVRRTAGDGLVRLGEPAVPALRHAAGRARPDRRPLYTAPLEKITAARVST